MKIVFESIDSESKIEIRNLEKKVGIQLLKEGFEYEMTFNKDSLHEFIGALLYAQGKLNKSYK